MKNLSITLLAFILYSFSLSAQKLKIKKGEILINKNVVAKITENGKKSTYPYSLADVNGEIVFNFKYYNESIDQNTFYRWLEMTQPNKDIVNEVDFEFVVFTMSMKKAFAEFFVRNLDFIDEKGLKKEEIANFFSTLKVSEEKKKLKEKGIEQQENLKKVEQIKPEVLPNYTIIANGILNDLGEPSILGKVNAVSSNGANAYTFYNILKESVATFNPIDRTLTGLNTNYKLPYSVTYRTNKLKEVNNILNFLFSKEELRALFPTAKQVNEVRHAIVKKNNDAFQKAKDNSENIYNVNGYVIDEKGERLEGEITAIFEEIKDPNDPFSNLNNIDDNGVGSVVKVTYKNQKGKTKTKSVSAKKNASFCILTSQGNETCYKAIKVHGGPITNSSDGALALVSSKGKFLEEIYKDGDFIIYQYPPTKVFYLKKSDKEKAFNFKISLLGKKEKKVAKLKEYLNNCNYADNHEYVEENFKNLDTIKQLINYYNTSCK